MTTLPPRLLAVDSTAAVTTSATPLARRRLALWFAAAALLSSCGGGGGGASTVTAPAGSQTPAPAPTPPAPSTPSAPTVTTVATGLVNPWSLAFFADGSMLVTERPGRMRRVAIDGTLGTPITGLPSVWANGQGGLLDVVLDPDFASTQKVFWSYAEAGSGAEAGLQGTAVASGTLNGTTMTNVTVIFRQAPKVNSTLQFGARLVFAADKTLFVTLGDRGQDDPSNPGMQWSQNPANTIGKVVRINRDGSVPAGNATTFGAGALPTLVSMGHRNPQGAAINPSTGALWIVEHGPQGGDELNVIQTNHNYGWPLKSYGCPYGSPVGNACRVGGGTHAPTYDEPLTYWVPTSIAPSGLMFYTGGGFPQWQGNVFAGALAGQAVWRMTLSGNTVTARESLFSDLGERIRDVKQGPDGWIYLLTDSASGRILRVQR